MTAWEPIGIDSLVVRKEALIDVHLRRVAVKYCRGVRNARRGRHKVRKVVTNPAPGRRAQGSG
jgi:hypothetical protein